MPRTFFVLFSIFFYHILDSATSSGKYEVILENATECSRPQPPFATKRIWISTFSIRRYKNTTFLSGRNRILAEVPFNNFSTTTFRMDDSGQERPLIHVDKQNCRSWLGRVFLITGNFRYNKKDCRVLKGTVGFSDVDLNRVFHSYPTWHATGRFVHRPRLIYNGTTIFCMQISVSIRNM